MKLFAGRTSDGDYELGTSKKDFEGDYGFTDGTYLMFFCARFFQKFTDLRLRKGEVVEIAHPIHLSIMKEK
jgi:hypothetical protein